LQLRECFQESFLCRLFSLAAIAEKAVSDMKNARTEPANDFRKRRFVLSTGEPRQFEL
jgi:hypothetical protein